MRARVIQSAPAPRRRARITGAESARRRSLKLTLLRRVRTVRSSRRRRPERNLHFCFLFLRSGSPLPALSAASIRKMPAGRGVCHAGSPLQLADLSTREYTQNVPILTPRRLRKENATRPAAPFQTTALEGFKNRLRRRIKLNQEPVPVYAANEVGGFVPTGPQI